MQERKNACPLQPSQPTTWTRHAKRRCSIQLKLYKAQGPFKSVMLWPRGGWRVLASLGSVAASSIRPGVPRESLERPSSLAHHASRRHRAGLVWCNRSVSVTVVWQRNDTTNQDSKSALSDEVKPYRQSGTHHKSPSYRSEPPCLSPRSRFNIQESTKGLGRTRTAYAARSSRRVAAATVAASKEGFSLARLQHQTKPKPT